MFIINKDSVNLVSADPDSILQKEMPSGLYNLDIVESFFGNSISFRKTDIYKGGKIIKSGIFKEVWDAIDNYNCTEAYEARDILGLMHKVGFIFNGEPGTGKTFLAGQIAEKFIAEEDAIGLIVNKWSGLKLHNIIDTLREFNKDRKIIIILDEFEKHNGNRAFEDPSLLSFLDGANSRNNTIIIATTNSTSKLPKVLTSRPGRFENIFTFEVNSEEVTKQIIIGMLNGKLQGEDQITRLLKKVNLKESKPTIDEIKVIVRDEIINMLKENKKGDT